MAYLTIESRQKKSKVPARLDLAQSITGVILGLFIMGHVMFVSAILLGPDTAYWVDKALEAQFLDPEGHGFPALVSLVAFVIFSVFVVHAGLALRKFPNSWRQYRIMQDQIENLAHDETKLWLMQAITGFILFFVGSAHVLSMMFNPEQIDPFLAAERYLGQQMWIFYLILLWAVVVHAFIGLYRVMLKWGILLGNPRKARKTLRVLQRVLTILYLIVGTASIVAYVKLGLDLNQPASTRYTPAHTSIHQSTHHQQP